MTNIQRNLSIESYYHISTTLLLIKQNFDPMPEMIFSKNGVKIAKVIIEKLEISLNTVNNDSSFKNNRENLQSDLDDNISKDEFMTPKKYVTRNTEAAPHQVSKQS